VEGPVRMKYRSTLTEENVAYLNKLDQYSSRPDSAGGWQAGGCQLCWHVCVQFGSCCSRSAVGCTACCAAYLWR
jgi:hypothetical protein